MTAKKESGKEKKNAICEKLCFEAKKAAELADAHSIRAAEGFSGDYMKALNAGKTEREFHHFAVEMLKKAGFVELSSQNRLKAGDKVYRSIHGKGLFAAVVGHGPLTDGLAIVGAHIDSPRLDLKPNPLYEDSEMALLKTHYYGGIKKYQWVAIPLALHGVVMLKNGEKLELSIGEDEKDPVFVITDLLPHLGKDQMAKKASEVIEGEKLNVLIGGYPHPDMDIEKRFKLGVLQLLNEQYGITERDLLSAELEIVPASKARDVGLDRAFIGAYGQDDRVCAYTALKALVDAKVQNKTQAVILSDKEEVGSNGNTGAHSQLYFFAMNELQARVSGKELSRLDEQRCIENSCMLSTDVTAAFDPNYPEVMEPLNAAYCGRGIGVCKYTGARGKGGTTDANAEYLNSVTRLFDEKKLPWQIGELGKVDQGGGGTIAYIFANAGMQVLDCGVPVLSMHSCFEVTSKLDVYNTYRAYVAFLENIN